MASKKTWERLDMDALKSIFYDQPTKNSLVAMNDILAERVRTNFTLVTMKIFLLCLEQIHWANENYQEAKEDGAYIDSVGNITIKIPKSVVAEKLGLKIDKKGSYSQKIKEHLKAAFAQGDMLVGINERTGEERYVHLFQEICCEEHHVLVILNNFFKGWLYPYSLDQRPTKKYITLWTHDIYQCKSNYSPRLLIYLRSHCDTRKENEQILTTKKLKEVLGLTKDDYMRKVESKRTGSKSFDRANFEKFSLGVAIQEINKGKMIEILPVNEKGDLFERVDYNAKTGSCKYKIRWKVSTYTARGDDGELTLVSTPSKTDKVVDTTSKVDVYSSMDGRYFLSTVPHNRLLYGKTVKTHIAEGFHADPHTLIRMEIPITLLDVLYETPDKMKPSLCSDKSKVIFEVWKK